MPPSRTVNITERYDNLYGNSVLNLGLTAFPYLLRLNTYRRKGMAKQLLTKQIAAEMKSLLKSEGAKVAPLPKITSHLFCSDTRVAKRLLPERAQPQLLAPSVK